MLFCTAATQGDESISVPNIFLLLLLLFFIIIITIIFIIIFQRIFLHLVVLCLYVRFINTYRFTLVVQIF